MTIRTGSSAFVDYQYELTYGGVTTDSTLALFGKNQNASNIEFTSNPEALAQLYRPTYESYKFGRNSGSCTVDYTLSNPFFLSALLNRPSQSESSGVYTQTWTSGTANRNLLTRKLRIGLESPGNTNDLLETATGVITTSVSIKTAVDQMATVSESLTWSNDEFTDNAEVPTPGNDDDFTPYNFVDGSLQFTPTGGSAFTVGTMQDVDLTIGITGEHLYEVGNPDAVDGYRKLFDITGKFNVAFEDATYSNLVRSRAEQTSAVLKFSNGLTGTEERTISILLSGVSIPSTSKSMAPGEPVFEDVNYQAREITATATNDTDFAPVQ